MQQQQMKSQQQQQQQLQPQQPMQQQQMLQPQQHQQQQQQPPPGSEDTTSNDAYSSEVLTKPNGGIGIKIKIKKAAEPQSDKSSNVSKKAKRDEESTNLPPIQQQSSAELQNSHTAGQTAVDTRPQKSQQSAVAQSEGPIRENNQSPAQSQQRHSTGQPFLTQHAQMTSKQQQSNQQEQQPQQQQQQLPHQPGQQSQQQAQQQQQQQQPQQLPQPPP